MEANEKKISIEFVSTKMDVTKRKNEKGSYFELNLFDYDTELLFPEEGVEPEKKIVSEFYGFYSTYEIKEIIKSLQQIIS